MIGLADGKTRSALVIACIVASLFFLCVSVLASGGGEHGGAHDSSKLVDLLYRGINFALLVIILIVVIRKTAIKEFFSARRQGIRRKLDDLAREKDEAESRYQELEKKLKEFEGKKTEIIEQFKADGAAEKERIIVKARERVTEILHQADLTIQQEIEAARNKLRHEVVDVAAQKAQEILAKDIKDRDQDHLVNDFIEKLEKLH